MMYIEHTPLEDSNLQYILRNYVPSSASAAASVLLAHVQETEEAATHFHQQAQAELADFRRAENIGGLQGNNHNRASRFGLFNGIGKATQLDLEKEEDEEIEAVNKKTLVLEEEAEEEEKEYFELLDVIDLDEEDQQTKEIAKKEEQTIGSYCLPSHEGRERSPEKIIVEIEEEDKPIQYILSKEPNQNQLQTTNKYKKTISAPQRTRCLRPIPAAIPIEFAPNNNQDFYWKALRPPPPPPRILNGTLPIFRSRDSVCNNIESTNYLSAHNGVGYPLEDGSETDGSEVEGYTSDRFEATCRQNSQMGIDLFSKLRRLLNLNTTSNQDTQDGSRKRRSGNWSSEDINPHQIKYRKVQNKYTKFFTQPLEDDLELVTSNPYRQENPLFLQRPDRAFRSGAEIPQLKTMHSNEKSKLRKSMFATPHTTHRLMKNTSYADVEFSDDDEPELIKGFGVGASSSGASVSGIREMPKIFNIPISRHTDDRIKFSSKPPPPLIEAHTGSILASSLMPTIDLDRKTTYANALKQNMSTISGHVLGGRPASSISTSGDSTSASMRGFNGLNNVRSSFWSTNPRSILAQEKETEEREKYRQLLEQMVPRIYGIENNIFPSTKSSQNQKLTNRRGDLHIAAATSTARSTPTDNRKSLLSLQPLRRPPLSSTINVDDDDDNDDDDDDDDVMVTGVTHLQSRPTKNGLPTVIIDDDDISDIIDLGVAERNVLSVCSKLRKEDSLGTVFEKKYDKLPYVEPVNTLQERFNTSPHLKDNWLEKWETKWNLKKKNRKQAVNEAEKIAEKLAADRRAAEVEIHERLKKFQIVDPELLVIDDFPEPVEEEEPEFIELTAEYQAQIKAAICGPPDQVLVSKFNLNITRRDIHTLLGHNWLNDEVINFYMNLLTERGEKKHESHGYPRVYAMNTFFIPRLMQAGHSGVKRWTRKVDIFSMDVIPVPVHVGGVHWCMAIIHIKNCSIKYYDSMGTPNPNVLKALEQYLKDESIDKRKQTFDTSGFEIESVREVPRQMNGSDCGVFSCMFAEYITRNKEITFSQQNMEYFRHKMILEIVRGELLH